MPDVIVTGMPRSGATVVAALIDYLPNTVCLNSPAVQLTYARRERNALPYCKWLTGDFTWQRAQLLRRKAMPDFRAADGSPLMDGERDPAQLKDESGEPKPVYFMRPTLQGDFILAMKHHVLYTALLPTLAGFDHFKIIAVIRHPLDILSSWLRREKPLLAKGNPPGIARFWPDALAIAESQGNEIDRMAQLYELHLARYHELREKVHIVKYEDVVSNPIVISQLFDEKKLPANAGQIQPRSQMHRGKEVDFIRESIRKYGVFTKEYYDR